ncbi:hypothetical protein [Streptomyces sp. NPDC055085]
MPVPEDAQALRSLLRTDLVAAMKARRTEAVSALRTAIAVIDNAEAVETPAQASVHAVSEHVAGAGTGTGVGSTEAERRVLSLDDVRALLQAQVDDRTREADRYDTHGQRDAALRLRREADVLSRYLVG